MPRKRTSIWFMLGLTVAAALVVTGLLFNGSVSAQAPEIAQSQLSNGGVDAAPNLQGEDPPTSTPIVPVDHAELEELQQEFATPQDITKACLSCHTEAANEIMQTSHWTWEFVNEITGQILGKKNVINNFCVATDSNEPRCTSCHVGYGWADDTFDFTAQENVDCLICHDTTGTYAKIPTGAGAPVEGLDMTNIAQNVGETSRETCGACHFYGGGGDEVKHGDMDSSLVNPDFELDVHMNAEGLDFTCATCHTTENHEIPGSRYSMDPEKWKGCEDCHTDPHALSVLNTHSEKIACQTCHIPEFARGDIATKMTWDWSTAGQKDNDGALLIQKDDDGNIIYHGLKGDFTWGENVTPEYVWFNGTVEYTLLEDTIDPSQTVPINQFIGDKEDPNAKIWPVKRFVGIQPYDSGFNTLAIPHLFGKDDTAYWANFDWGLALEAGMEYTGAPYSGEYGFVETEMYWPITHMVAPATEAVQCQECHTEEESRLDFSALGYGFTDSQRLMNFPPKATSEIENPELYKPSSCTECHENEYNMWRDSNHGAAGTGCVACHQLEGEEEHPISTYTVDHSGELCGTCHLDQYDDWKTSVHGEKMIACASCHEPHSQDMILAPESQSVCENCHLLKADEVVHSTHTLAGVLCSDCHVNTMEGTGHTFTVGTGTCMECHGETIHTSAHIAELTGGNVEIYNPEAVPAEVEAEEPAHEEEMVAEKPSTEGAGVNLPVWIISGIGAFFGVGGYWLIAGQEPGSQHPENTSDESDEE